ncbi:SPOCS domain-containing protein [Lachnospiraceae bacterium 62-35]
MELSKKNIHMNRWKTHAATQMTLDDDFIVPDTMDDAEQMVLSTGDIQIESSRAQGEKVTVKGKLDFRILYRKAEGGMQALAGSMPFEEVINVPSLEDRDYTAVTGELDDLNVGMINSRKFSVKALITLDVTAETLYDVEAAVDIAGGDTGAEVEALREKMEVAAIAVRRKDTYRVKESITLSGNKPNIDNILWSEMRLCSASCRPIDGKARVEGELIVFIIYAGEGDTDTIQWLEESVPFSGEIELPEAMEEMIPQISMRLVHKDMEAKPDYDGEMRELEIDAVVELDIKLYEEEEIELLSDLYSTNREVVLETGEACFDRILTKNLCKCKVAEKLEISHSDRILQICHSEGNVKIDETEIKDDGLHIEGVLEVKLLYLTADDAEPVQSSTELVPFQYTAEAKGIDSDSIFQMNTGVDQMTAVMIGGDMVEVKAVINLDLLVLQPMSQPVIVSAAEEPMNVQKLQKLPGIVGYIVQNGDTLWKIAKKFHTTMDNIIETNGLSSENINPGEKLILVKEIAKG